MTDQKNYEYLYFTGDQVFLDFSLFFMNEEEQELRFKLNVIPDGLSFDKSNGHLTGQIPTDITETTEYQLQLSGLTADNKAVKQVNIKLVVLPAPDLLVADEENLATKTPAASMNHRWVEYLIDRYFAFIALSSSEGSFATRGALLEKLATKSGCTIYIFENTLAINRGNSLEASDNSGALIAALKEVLQKHVSQKGWQTINLESSDPANLKRAWLVIQEQGLLNIANIQPSAEWQKQLASLKEVADKMEHLPRSAPQPE